MKIALVSYGNFESPGIIHMHHFANELMAQGHQVLFLLHGDLTSAATMREPPAYALAQVQFAGESISPALREQVRRFAPDIMHAWTPRNVTARVGMDVAFATGARLVIHYEDDEEAVYARYVGDLFRDPAWYASTVKQPGGYGFFHPMYSPAACHLAAGFTAITHQLIPRLEQYWVKPVQLLYPGVDLERFTDALAPEPALIDELGLRGKIVLMYSGAIGEMHDFHLLIEAAAGLRREFPNLVILHIGHIFTPEVLDEAMDRLNMRDCVKLAGPVMHKDVPRYLALADILVQTGKPNAFNESRLPSKLPEYMAMGKPIVTFSVGFGRLLQDGVDVLKTYTEDPAELGDCLRRLLQDADLRARLGAQARKHAAQWFNWRENTAGLLRFYAQLCADPRHPLDAPRREIAAQRFAQSATPLDQVRINLAVIGTSPRAQQLADALAETTRARVVNHATFAVQHYDALPEQFTLANRPNVIVFADGAVSDVEASRYVARIVVWEREGAGAPSCADFTLPAGETDWAALTQQIMDAPWKSKLLRAPAPPPTPPPVEAPVEAPPALPSIPPRAQYRNRLSYLLAQVANNYEHGGMRLVFHYGINFLRNV